jgi:4-carboxymuconolactone decarboxylase
MTYDAQNPAGPGRMPMLGDHQMTDAQRAAAAALIAGPRGAVGGPFVALMRSPGLLNVLQKVGDYLRSGSAMPRLINDLLMVIVARHWTQQFEWRVHQGSALKEGVTQDTLDAVADGRRPLSLQPDEQIAYDFVTELLHNKGVSDATYASAVEAFGEAGVIDMTGLCGYYVTVSMIMNVARTPPVPSTTIPALKRFPL